jgi:hypothetical protein
MRSGIFGPLAGKGMCEWEEYIISNFIMCILWLREVEIDGTCDTLVGNQICIQNFCNKTSRKVTCETWV